MKSNETIVRRKLINEKRIHNAKYLFGSDKKTEQEHDEENSEKIYWMDFQSGWCTMSNIH